MSVVTSGNRKRLLQAWYLPVMEFLLYQVALPLLCLALMFAVFSGLLPVPPADAAIYFKIALSLLGLALLALAGIFGLTWCAPPNKRIIFW